MTDTTIVATRLLAPVDPATGWLFVQAGVGPDGEIVRAVASERPRWLDRERLLTSRGPQRVTLRVEQGERACVLDDFVLGSGFHLQPLGDEGFLMVRGSARVGVPNARILGWDGGQRAEFRAGDAIADVQVSRRGDVWVGYFDEGVFGNDPLGHQGLVRLDRAGNVTFGFADATTPLGVPRIDDCYALNVASDVDTWLYYYGDFPLVHLRDGALAEWWPEMPVAGTRAFAVHAGHVLFAGGYERANTIRLVMLADLDDAREFDLVDESGEPLGFRHAVGRGARLYFIGQDGAVHVAALDRLQDIR